MEAKITDEELIRGLKNIYSTKYEKMFSSEKPFVLTFAGAPGSGKSSIASIFSYFLDIPILINDEARSEVGKMGYNREGMEAKKLRELMPDVAYRSSSSFILDYNCQFSTHFLRKKCEQFGYGYYIVELENDKATLIERIKNRANNASDDVNFSKAGLDNLQLYYHRMETEWDEKEYKENCGNALKCFSLEADSVEDIIERIKEISEEIRELTPIENKNSRSLKEVEDVIVAVVTQKEKQVFDARNIVRTSGSNPNEEIDI